MIRYIKKIADFYQVRYKFDYIMIPILMSIQLFFDINILLSIEGTGGLFRSVVVTGLCVIILFSQLVVSLIVNRKLWIIKEEILDWYDANITI